MSVPGIYTLYRKNFYVGSITLNTDVVISLFYLVASSLGWYKSFLVLGMGWMIYAITQVELAFPYGFRGTDPTLKVLGCRPMYRSH